MCKRLFFASTIAITSAVLAAASADATTWIVGGPHFFGVDIAEAANGNRILMVGTGTFTGTDSSGTITGGGTYTIQNAAGAILGKGTFSATSLESFASYGGPDGVEGGKLITHVHLVSVMGDAADVVLTVTSLVGSPPPGNKECVNLDLSMSGGNGNNYNSSVHGETLFVR